MCEIFECTCDILFYFRDQRKASSCVFSSDNLGKKFKTELLPLLFVQYDFSSLDCGTQVHNIILNVVLYFKCTLCDI